MEIKVQEFKRILKIVSFLEISKINIRHQVPLCSSHVKSLEELGGGGGGWSMIEGMVELEFTLW